MAEALPPASLSVPPRCAPAAWTLAEGPLALSTHPRDGPALLHVPSPQPAAWAPAPRWPLPRVSAVVRSRGEGVGSALRWGPRPLGPKDGLLRRVPGPLPNFQGAEGEQSTTPKYAFCDIDFNRF